MSSTYAVRATARTEARPNDGVLVRQRLHGNDEAFAVFYRRYHRRLVGYCVRRTQNEALAQDLAHDTLIKALESLGDYDLDRPAWPWLKVIAHNTMIDHIRKHKREDLSEQPVNEEDAVEDDLTDLLAERPVLVAALAELPDRQQVALRLRYLEDWKSSEAGKFLDLSRPAVEQLLFRARKNLRDSYERLVDESAGMLAGLLIPLYRLRDALAARFRARVSGWEFFQTFGPAALDIVGQTAAAFVALGLMAAVVNSATSTEASTPQISTPASYLTATPTASRAAASAEAPDPFTSTSGTRDADSTPAPRRYVAFEAPGTSETAEVATMNGAMEGSESAGRLHIHREVEANVGPIHIEHDAEAWVDCPEDHLVLTPACQVARQAPESS